MNNMIWVIHTYNFHRILQCIENVCVFLKNVFIGNCSSCAPRQTFSTASMSPRICFSARCRNRIGARFPHCLRRTGRNRKFRRCRTGSMYPNVLKVVSMYYQNGSPCQMAYNLYFYCFSYIDYNELSCLSRSYYIPYKIVATLADSKQYTMITCK